MTVHRATQAFLLTALPLILVTTAADAHKLRQRGEAVTVADSSLTVTPTGDWNSLSKKVGKNTETWTLDGEQLNDVTFFGGIAAGSSLVKEKSKKRDPMPKFTKETLLIEVPELLERTYRTYKNSGSFRGLSAEPKEFLGRDGVVFTYEYTDQDELTRKGEANAVIIGGKLYMITFDAPRLNYFDKGIAQFRALTSTANLR
jgi:hypothetical protein